MQGKFPRPSRDAGAPHATRGLALALVLGGILASGYALFILARPVYWKLYAELTHRHVADSDAELRNRLVSELLKEPDTSKQQSIQQQQQKPSQAAASIIHQQRLLPPGTTGTAAAAGSTGSTAAEKAEAHKQQWEDEWKKAWEETEAKQKAAARKHHKAKEDALVQKYNITLTRQAVQGLARDGVLYLTFANHHYTEFALTWVYHATKANITNFVIGAMDEQILYSLAKRKIYTFSMQSGLPTGDFGWGSKTFGKMGRKKINLIATFLKLGVQVAITDIDVLWLRNPTPFFNRYPDADVLTSTDEVRTTVGKEEVLEKYPDAGAAFNIGVMLFRANSLPMVEHWIQKIEADQTVWDQSAFNDVIRKGQVILPEDPNHYFMGYNGTLKVGVLPVAWFSHGHAYFVQAMHKHLGTDPYSVHAIYQYSGTPGKKHRFREAMLWLDGGDYYQTKGGFLTYEPDIPAELLEKAGPRTGGFDLNNTVGHFELMKHQLKQLRNALALATVLHRTIILPKLWCGLDRYWAPHTGTIGGATTKLPYLCPADHVLRLEAAWARKDWPEAEFGPNIDYREHSFLENPATPDSLKGSIVTVTPCDAGTVGCADGTRPATVERTAVQLQKKLDSEHVRMALSSVISVSVLKFKHVNDAFGNFTRPEDWTKFANRIKQYPDIWCCVNAHPGHVFYNMLWDLPHTDMFNRQWNGTWEPKTGP